MSPSFRRVVAVIAMVSLLSPTAMGLPVIAAHRSVDVAEASTAASSSTAAARLEIGADLLALGETPRDAATDAAALSDADVAVLGAHPAMLQRASASGGAQEAVTAQLTGLGYSTPEARLLVMQMTPADLAVLAAHPEMLQRAGDLSQKQTAFLIWGLIFAGLIAWAIFGNASSSGSL